jgi:hypothetical protein
MSTAKPVTENTFSPQYFIIPKSDPQYDLIKKQLLDSTHSHVGSSHYFIRAAREKGCVCRIKCGNGTVLFYEILDHRGVGISDEDLREAIGEPSNASPLPEYFYITPKIEEKLRVFLAADHVYSGKKCKTGSLA